MKSQLLWTRTVAGGLASDAASAYNWLTRDNTIVNDNTNYPALAWHTINLEGGKFLRLDMRLVIASIGSITATTAAARLCAWFQRPKTPPPLFLTTNTARTAMAPQYGPQQTGAAFRALTTAAPFYSASLLADTDLCLPTDVLGVPPGLGATPNVSIEVGMPQSVQIASSAPTSPLATEVRLHTSAGKNLMCGGYNTVHIAFALFNNGAWTGTGTVTFTGDLRAYVE